MFRKHNRRAAGQVVQTILVRDLDVVQAHDPNRVRDKGLCPRRLHGCNHLPDHDRRDDPERSLRAPVGLDSDPLVLLKARGEVHLLQERFKLSRDAVTVVPAEGAGVGEVDFGHEEPQYIDVRLKGRLLTSPTSL